jgi:ankyrin repeat protein
MLVHKVIVREDNNVLTVNKLVCKYAYVVELISGLYNSMKLTLDILRVLNLLQLFLENNARVDVFDLDGKSALHLAAENGSIEVCEALLARNAFINSKTKTGWTALHYASQKGYKKLVDFLIRKHNATIDSMTIVSYIISISVNAKAFESMVINLSLVYNGLNV